MTRFFVLIFTLVLFAVTEASSIYRYRNKQSNAIPRSSLLISGRGYMPGFADEPIFLRKRREVQEGKRSGRTIASVPRSGLLISGRGWLPGFYDQDWMDQIFL